LRRCRLCFELCGVGLNTLAYPGGAASGTQNKNQRLAETKWHHYHLLLSGYFPVYGGKIPQISNAKTLTITIKKIT
jgi:hypothetical protein